MRTCRLRKASQLRTPPTPRSPAKARSTPDGVVFRLIDCPSSERCDIFAWRLLRTTGHRLEAPPHRLVLREMLAWRSRYAAHHGCSFRARRGTAARYGDVGCRRLL